MQTTEELLSHWIDSAIGEVAVPTIRFLCDHIQCFPVFGVVPNPLDLELQMREEAAQAFVERLKETLVSEESKRNRGKGRRNKQPVLNEPAKLSRHLNADWAPETKTIIASIQMEENRLVTNRFIAKLMFDNKLYVVLQSEENPLLNEKVVQITKEGFFEVDGPELGFKIFTITIPTGNGYGIQFKWDRSGKVFVN